MTPAAFSEAIEHGLATNDLADALRSFRAIDSAEHAEVFLAALPRFPIADEGRMTTPLGVVARLLQGTELDAVSDVLAAGFEAVHGFYDRAYARFVAGGDDTASSMASDIVLMLKVYAMYASQGGMERVVVAARNPQLEDQYLWAVVFRIYASKQHPLGRPIVQRLRTLLPNGFAGVAFLDACNEIARESSGFEHPFSSPDGIARLEGWLRDPNKKNFSYAHSSAAALPHVGSADRARLIAIASTHTERAVRLEAAWVDAKEGGVDGITTLAEACLDPHASAVACAYLTEVGQALAIPEAARHPDFQAMAEASRWLQHPSEFGQQPDELELYDSRVLTWPPTNDRRRVWLFKWKNGSDTGLIMTGSITFALFDEVTAELSPEDAYALHCCWELAANGDARAPSKRSTAAGRALLGLTPN